jgi:hypothetical protein
LIVGRLRPLLTRGLCLKGDLPGTPAQRQSQLGRKQRAVVHDGAENKLLSVMLLKGSAPGFTMASSGRLEADGNNCIPGAPKHCAISGETSCISGGTTRQFSCVTFTREMCCTSLKPAYWQFQGFNWEDAVIETSPPCRIADVDPAGRDSRRRWNRTTANREERSSAANDVQLLSRARRGVA